MDLLGVILQFIEGIIKSCWYNFLLKPVSSLGICDLFFSSILFLLSY